MANSGPDSIPHSKPLSGLHSLQILRGLETNKSLLSTSTNGEVVELYNKNDGSGRQEWEFVVVSQNPILYNIIVSDEASPNRKYLSASTGGGTIELHSGDDGSGRQRWELILVPNPKPFNTHNIKVSGGVSNSNHQFLSAASNGETVYLSAGDDGSGRQRWQIQNPWRT